MKLLLGLIQYQELIHFRNISEDFQQLNLFQMQANPISIDNK